MAPDLALVLTMTMRDPYRVTERLGWSYVVDEDGCDAGEFSGPWRYRSDAQEYCNELNRNIHLVGETGRREG